MNSRNAAYRPAPMALAVATFFLSAAAPPGAAVEIRVVNNCPDMALTRHPVVVSVASLPGKLRSGQITVTGGDGERTLSQVDDFDGDGGMDELVFLVDLPPGGSRAFSLSPGPSSRTTDLTVKGPREFANRRITCRLAEDAKGRIAVGDNASGKLLVERLGFARGGKPAPPHVLASGPVRTVVEQVYKATDGFRIAERYMLYTGAYGLELQLLVTNLHESARPLPDLLGDEKLVVGNQGELLTRRWDRVEILSVNWYRSSRHNVFWINPTTGCSMGITGHEHWEAYGPTLWINPVHKTPEGRAIHAKPMHPWLLPGEDLTEVRARAARTRMPDGRIRFGKVGRVTPDPRPPFRHTWKTGEYQTLGAGRSRTFHLSLRFYKSNDPMKTVEAFEADDLVAAGAVNVFAEDGAVLTAARAPLYLTERFASADRWLPDKGARLKVTDGRARIFADTAGVGIRTPFHRDFLDVTEVSMRVTDLSAGTGLQVTLEDCQTRRKYVQGPVTAPGEHAFGIHAAGGKGKKADNGDESGIPFTDFRSCVLHLDLVRTAAASSAERPLAAAVEHVSVAWPRPPAPEMLGPAADSTIRPVALTVSLRSTTPSRTDKAYEYQIAADPQFGTVLSTAVHPCRMRVAGSYHLERTFLPAELLGPGTYYARCRSIAPLDIPGDWTARRMFRVEKGDLAPKPPVLEIANTKPFFFTNARRGEEFRTFWMSLPQKLRPHYGCQVSYKYASDPERMAKFLEGGYPIVVVFKGSRPADTTLLERLYRTSPNVVGFAFGEAGLPIRSLERALKLSGSFGRYAGNFGDLVQIRVGMDEGLYAALGEYGEYFWPMPKSMRPKIVGQRYSPSLGLWLSGRVARWGIETEWWAPYHIGIKDRDMRAVDWMPPFLAGLIGGAQVWRIESFCPGKICKMWDPDKGEPGPVWTRALRPFFIDLFEHELIPTRQQVLAKTPVAFLGKREYLDETYPGPPHWPTEALQAIHGRPTGSRQWLPETSRYFLVPMLPVRATEKEKEAFKAVVDFEKFGRREDIAAYFNTYHPPVESEAFVTLVGDTGLVHNTFEEEPGRENVKPQSYVLRFTKGPVEQITGRVGYHEYIIARQRQGGLFLHTNNYAERQTTLTLHAAKKVRIRVEPGTAMLRRQTDAGRITLTVGHRHEEGVTRIFVEPR